MTTGLQAALLSAILAVAATTNARAQSDSQSDNLHFSVDRPGISDFPTITPKGHLQIEMGLEYYQREDHRSLFLPTLMLRSAITNWLEVRMVNRFLRIDSVVENPDDKFYYFGAVEAKALLFIEKGWKPASAVLVGYSITPNTSAKLRGPLWGNYALLLFENNIHNKWVFNYNTGVTWNGYSSQTSMMYSFATEFEISDQHEVFVEQSTFFNGTQKNDHWINIGYTHLEARHSQLDFSMGVNLNGGEPDYFFAAGYSTRFGYGKVN
jgi:hypothetical protein